MRDISDNNLSNIVLKAESLNFSRGERVILQDVSMAFCKGHITGIMGPSGVGKTTILRLLTAQISPDSGFVYFCGTNLNTLNRAGLYDIRHRMSILFQSGALFTDMSVFDNVAFPLRELTSLNEKSITEKANEMLNSVGLFGAREMMPSDLSGGMSRRVAFARAIVTSPELILFDEPFVGQDPISKGVLLRLIESLRQQNITAIIVSHDIPETLQLADYIYILSQGKIVAHGSKDSIVENDTPVVRQFMRGMPDGPIPFNYSV